MDGNRRFARQMGLPCSEGHSVGYDTMEKTLEWCLEFGVKVVSVYAFSIENFSRSCEEVTALMDLAESKFSRMKEKGVGIINKYGAKINVLGDIWLLPPKVRIAMARAMEMSKNNNRCTLNVCFSYTSRHEMQRSLNLMGKGVSQGYLESSDIDPELFSKCLYTGSQPPPDVLVRTSGETRLSDFLLTQSSFCLLRFVDVLWPNFSFFDVVSCIIFYQRNVKSLNRRRRDREMFNERQRLIEDVNTVSKEQNVNLTPLIQEKVESEFNQHQKNQNGYSWKWVSASLMVPLLGINQTAAMKYLTMIVSFCFVFGLIFLPGTPLLIALKHFVRDTLNPWQLAFARAIWGLIVLVLRPVRLFLLKISSPILGSAAASVGIAKEQTPDSITNGDDVSDLDIVERLVDGVSRLRKERERRVQAFLSKLDEDQLREIEIASR